MSEIEKKKRVNWKGVATAVIIMIVVFLIGAGFLWQQITLRPSEKALIALQSDNLVMVSQEEGFITFEPKNEIPSTGFVFYPGALVDIRSYAPLLREVAAQGYIVVIPSMPLNLAFLNSDAGAAAISKYPDIDNWVIGGHSLGGTFAANYATQQSDIEGIIFLASYPANDRLKGSDITILSIFASLDGVTTPQDIEDSRHLLPSDAEFIEIIGGNHSQFGSYGLQSRDNKATISPEEQWSLTANAIGELLASIPNN